MTPAILVLLLLSQWLRREVFPAECADRLPSFATAIKLLVPAIIMNGLFRRARFGLGAVRQWTLGHGSVPRKPKLRRFSSLPVKESRRATRAVSCSDKLSFFCTHAFDTISETDGRDQTSLTPFEKNSTSNF